jgi:hypothetical protein
MTGTPDMPPKAPGESLQGLGAPLATMAASMGEVASPAPPQPSREMAELPLVETGAGSDLFLTLVRTDGTRLSVILGGAECVAIAADLLQAARIRCGRAGWPGKVVS